MTAKATATAEVMADETATTQERYGDNNGNCDGNGDGSGNAVATTKAYLTVTLTAGETALRLGNIFFSEKHGSTNSSMDRKKSMEIFLRNQHRNRNYFDNFLFCKARIILRT